MKTNLLPPADAPDGSEEVIINQGVGANQKTKRMAAALLASAGTRPTPAELKTAILGALTAGQNIAFTNNADGTVGVAVSQNPDLKGTPTAPTANPGTNTTQIATTGFVKAAVDVIVTALTHKQGSLVEGPGVHIVDNGDGTFTISATGGGSGGGGLVDGNYGDITVSGSGTVMRVNTVTNGTVTVPDEVYGPAWSGKLGVPTKNSLYNKLEAINTAINGRLSATSVGAPSGVASLDSGGKVPAGQLPSYVDDVLEFSSSAAFPNPGETGKIYVALDTNAQWRWSGTAFTQLVASPGTTDNVPEGAANKYYTDVRVRGSVMTGLASTTGTPAATDSLLTVLGKLYRQAFGGILLAANAPIATASLAIDGAANAIRNLYFFAAGAYAADIELMGDNATLKHNATTAHRFDVNGTQKAIVTNGGFTVSGVLKGSQVNVDNGDNTGTVYLGPTGNYFIKFDGANYSFGAGATTQIVAGGVGLNTFGSVYGVGVTQSRSGQVGYHMYNGGGVAEWLTYQPAHASGDDYRIATDVGGVITDRLKIAADGTVTVPGNFTTKDVIASRGDGTGVLFFGSNAGNNYLQWDGAKYNMPGGALVVGGNITSSSDRRLKQDVRPLTGAREILSAIGSYRFTMRDKASVGVIAQEVEEVLPELVEVDGEGMLSVDYGKLASVLIADNNAMAERIAALEAMVAKLAA